MAFGGQEIEKSVAQQLWCCLVSLHFPDPFRSDFQYLGYNTETRLVSLSNSLFLPMGKNHLSVLILLALSSDDWG